MKLRFRMKKFSFLFDLDEEEHDEETEEWMIIYVKDTLTRS